MPNKPTYVVRPEPGFGRNRRGVSFLICDQDRQCNAKQVFDEMNASGKNQPKRAVRHAFRSWLDHHDRLTWLFHGFPSNLKHKDCFTFKWELNNKMQRFYGFLHPANDFEQGFQLCILIRHTTKDGKRTNPSELDRIIERRNSAAVQAAIKAAVSKLKQEGWPEP